MRKKILSILLAACLIFSLLPVSAFADTTAGGTFGDHGKNLTWTLDSDGTLTISGMVAMKDFSSKTPAPWEDYSGSIKSLVINDGVKSIGNRAFSRCSNLTSVTIPDSVTSIGGGHSMAAAA